MKKKGKKPAEEEEEAKGGRNGLSSVAAAAAAPPLDGWDGRGGGSKRVFFSLLFRGGKVLSNLANKCRTGGSGFHSIFFPLSELELVKNESKY